MKNFVSYIRNDKFAVGCTGKSVYVYNKSGKNIAVYKNLKYAYYPLFCPKRNIFIVKSTEPYLYFFSLTKNVLIKKIRLKNHNHQPQDSGFCFSLDGKLLYNIEYETDLSNHLVVYNTRSFAEQHRYFQNLNMLLYEIEPAADGSSYFLLGFIQSDVLADGFSFLSEFKNGKILDIRKIAEEECDYLRWYKSLERSGFSKKMLSILGEKPLPESPISLEAVYRTKI